MAHSRKTFGKDVKQPAANEFVGREGEDSGFSSITGCPVEADVSLWVVSDDAFGTDGTAFDVLCEVAQCGLAAANVLELHVPNFLSGE